MAARDASGTAPRDWGWPRVWAVSVGVSLVIGVLQAAHGYIGYNLAGVSAGGGTMPALDPTFAALAGRSLPSWICAGLIVPPAIYIARRFPLFPRPTLSNGAIHVAAAFGFAAVFVVGAGSLRYVLFVQPGGVDAYSTALLRYYALYYNQFFVYYWTIVGVTSAIGYYREARSREAEKRAAEARASEARLEALRRQLHPHFLFNLLSAISTLVLEGDRKRAVHALSDLSDLLRVFFSRDEPFIALRDELRLLEMYLDLQRLRLEDRLRVETRVHPDTLDRPVPPLLLQPLVENAIEHGVARVDDGGVIELETALRGERLEITVSNPLPRGAAGHDGMGIGLANTRERVLRSYGGGGVELSAVGDRAVTRVWLPVASNGNGDPRGYRHTNGCR